MRATIKRASLSGSPSSMPHTTSVGALWSPRTDRDAVIGLLTEGHRVIAQRLHFQQRKLGGLHLDLLQTDDVGAMALSHGRTRSLPGRSELTFQVGDHESGGGRVAAGSP